MRATRRSRLEIPPGSVDCHTHIFDSRFPLSPEREYNPPDSTLDDLVQMHSQLGIERVVFTQPSCYGADNSVILSAMAEIPDRSRAVVTLTPAVSDAELRDMDRQGVGGARLNLDNRGATAMTLAEVPALADRIRPLGWHLEFLFPPQKFEELLPLFHSLPVPISIGHFGYMPAREGVNHPPFQALLGLVSEGNTWVKLSGPNRLGIGDLPPWDEVVPMAHALIEVRPDRMLWGSDWPHPNKFEAQPNDADLIEQLALWAPDPATRERILIENPAVLYGF